MTELSMEELERTAAAYHERLVPALFQEWTDHVLDAARVGSGQRVLDVACGTGALASAAAARVGTAGSVAGLDINPGMVSVASRHSPDIDWRQGSAEALPFADATFDAVISQFGLMFFTDRTTAIREMTRVLAPGGRLAVAVFDSLENNPAYGTIVAILERLVGEQAADALRFPFVLGSTDELVSLFAASGIEDAAVRSQEANARFPSVRDMVLADVKGWFPLTGIDLSGPTLDAVISEAKAALEPYLVAGGAVAFPVSAHIMTVTKA